MVWNCYAIEQRTSLLANGGHAVMQSHRGGEHHEVVHGIVAGLGTRISGCVCSDQTWVSIACCHRWLL